MQAQPAQMYELDEWEVRKMALRSMFMAHVQHMEALIDSQFIEVRMSPPLRPFIQTELVLGTSVRRHLSSNP
jgi:hypothetical protein